MIVLLLGDQLSTIATDLSCPPFVGTNSVVDFSSRNVETEDAGWGDSAD